MTYSDDGLRAAYAHSSGHRAEIEASRICGCFHCCKTFSPSEVEDWIKDPGDTAHCPRCFIDSVIGDASGLPVEDPAFLAAMHAMWFTVGNKAAFGMAAEDDLTLEWETRFHDAHWKVAQDWAELDKTNPFGSSAIDDLLTNTTNDLLDQGVDAKAVRRALVRAYFQRDLHPNIPGSWFPR